MREDYTKIKTQPVYVKGIRCEFYDMRIDRETVPAGKHLYEVAGDDDDGGTPARIRKGIMVNFYGSLICDQELPLEEDGEVMWLEPRDFQYGRDDYLKVGSYTPPDENGKGEKIEREFYGQGHIFKDAEAFYHRPDDPCYIPELSDTVYTRNDIMAECNDQDDLAEEVFETLDWQHVSSLLEDWQTNGELDTCKECGKMFNCYGAEKCPYCGAKYEGSEE